ncbi:hypothetical protein DWU98_06485 [Dyella monticola]|uniref:YscD cytoplasmic domain-containing protein n=1 Tax=Dyella monticola TaxID=1927958 RepID=A0A370X300_9GAMM|nr:FHA domain-containing protein [Dyella monticola]RDS82794.1 hypothetical protein DWU98_06485 [Dyella monticola]
MTILAKRSRQPSSANLETVLRRRPLTRPDHSRKVSGISTVQYANKNPIDGQPMNTCALRILSGMHADAIIQLAGKTTWSIGHDETGDILLLDEHIEPLHARLFWQPDQGCGELIAEVEGIYVFDDPLKVGQKADLTVGSRFSLGPVRCDVVLITSMDPLGTPTIGALSAQQERVARMRFLRRAHWFRYALLCLAYAGKPRYLIPLAGSLAASTAVVALMLSKPDLSTEYREESMREIQQSYPNVSHRLDPVTGYTTYNGYVDDQKQLGALRQLALRANYGAVIMNVLPMDVLALNIQATLEQHYREPRVTVSGPGEVAVTILTADAIKDLDGWNFEAVEARMKNNLPDLKKVTITLIEPRLDEVRVPLDRLGFSIVSSSTGEPIVINKRGDRLFPGAVVPEGHVDDISLCRVKLKAADDAAIFDAYTQKDKHNGCQ